MILSASDRLLVELCQSLHPEAETEVEAVDLTASELHKQIRRFPKGCSQFYRLRFMIDHLNSLRERLNDIRAKVLQTFTTRN